ncbi:putative virulence effector protein [Salmonella enterica subsp. enterica]|uniref:Putative virulence effector protein n=1 Tax=Salmonella enterica I TaxID=59201 RepID=A0A379WTZ5_SALET|nr:putative virulence effector protein [Salmonella enterica subsp. enterica]
MGKPGVHWGTLQALDKHSMQRLVEWLSQATSAPQRQARLQALREQLRGRVRDLLPMFDDARLPVETVIRRLQAQAARHGDLLAGLLPPVQNFEALLRTRQSREEQVTVYLMTRSISLPTNQRALQRQKVTKQAIRRTKCGSIICASGPTAGIMRSVWDWNRRCSTPWRRF